MSYARRNYGRFSSTTANEAYQRQLTAPVHKWKKAWVAPSGLAPESSYKICKWVRIKEKATFAGAEDDLTPAPEGEGDDEEGEGEGEGEGDEDMEEDDNEGEGDGEEGDGEADESKVEGEEPAATETTTLAPESKTAATISAADSKTAKTTKTEAAEVDNTPIQVDSAVLPLPTENEQSNELPPHVGASNAIEISNAAAFSTEVGLGDVGSSGVEITVPAVEPSTATTTLPEGEEIKGENGEGHDEAMDVEEPSLRSDADAHAGAGAELPVESDQGLVMGEVEPPVVALNVDNGDVPPPETE